jgi:hypothetical protein
MLIITTDESAGGSLTGWRIFICSEALVIVTLSPRFLISE